MPNTQRIQEALDRIEHNTLNPTEAAHKHDQAVWMEVDPDKVSEHGVAPLDCLTACCFAGEAVLASGQWVPVLLPAGDNELADPERANAAWHVIHAEDVDKYERAPERVSTFMIDHVARRLLQLDSVDASILFKGDANLEYLWVAAYMITGGAISLPQRIVDALPAPAGPGDTLLLNTAAESALSERIDKCPR